MKADGMEPMVRAAGLRGLPSVIGTLGGDPGEWLARFGLGTAVLDSDDAVIPALDAARLLETAAAELSCPDLGLRLSAVQDAAVLGPVAVAIENSATFGEALDITRRFLFVHSDALTVDQIPDPSGRPGIAGLRYATTGDLPLPPQTADLGLGLLHRITTLLHQGPYGLRSVHLPHPRLAPVGVYRDFFAAEVRFNLQEAVLRVPAGLAGEPLPGGNQMLRDLALAYLTSHFPSPGSSVASRVRVLLARSLGPSVPSVAAIAGLLRLHPRTLQRRLAAEQTSFEGILDEVRRAAAFRLITTTDLSFGQVTAMVGLAEQSALTRAVRRWFGLTPRRLRSSMEDDRPR
jgi:AraC-like DNA-binding protein